MKLSNDALISAEATPEVYVLWDTVLGAVPVQIAGVGVFYALPDPILITTTAPSAISLEAFSGIVMVRPLVEIVPNVIAELATVTVTESLRVAS